MRKVRVFSDSVASVATLASLTNLQPSTWETIDVPLQGNIKWIRVRTTDGAPAASWNLQFLFEEDYRGDNGDKRPLWDTIGSSTAMTLGNWSIVHPPNDIGFDLIAADDLYLQIGTDQAAYDLDIDVCIEEVN